MLVIFISVAYGRLAFCVSYVCIIAKLNDIITFILSDPVGLYCKSRITETLTAGSPAKSNQINDTLHYCHSEILDQFRGIRN